MSGLSFQLFDEALVDCSCCCPLLRPDPERQHGAAGAACTESVLGSFFWNCKTCFLGVIDRLDEDVSKIAVAFGDRSVSFFVANPQGSESQQVWSVVRGFELFLQYRQERGVRHFIPADAIKARLCADVANETRSNKRFERVVWLGFVCIALLPAGLHRSKGSVVVTFVIRFQALLPDESGTRKTSVDNDVDRGVLLHAGRA